MRIDIIQVNVGLAETIDGVDARHGTYLYAVYGTQGTGEGSHLSSCVVVLVIGCDD